MQTDTMGQQGDCVCVCVCVCAYRVIASCLSQPETSTVRPSVPQPEISATPPSVPQPETSAVLEQQPVTSAPTSRPKRKGSSRSRSSATKRHEPDSGKLDEIQDSGKLDETHAHADDQVSDSKKDSTKTEHEDDSEDDSEMDEYGFSMPPMTALANIILEEEMRTGTTLEYAEPTLFIKLCTFLPAHKKGRTYIYLSVPQCELEDADIYRLATYAMFNDSVTWKHGRMTEEDLWVSDFVYMLINDVTGENINQVEPLSLTDFLYMEDRHSDKIVLSTWDRRRQDKGFGVDMCVVQARVPAAIPLVLQEFHTAMQAYQSSIQ